MNDFFNYILSFKVFNFSYDPSQAWADYLSGLLENIIKRLREFGDLSLDVLKSILNLLI